MRKFLFFTFLMSSHLMMAQPPKSTVIAKSKALFEKRSFDEAKVVLNSVAKTSSDYADAQYYLGRIAVEQKAYEESISRFEKAIEANDKVAEFHNWLGVMYGVIAMDASAFRQAYLAPKIKNEFEKSAAIDPLNLQTQWGLITYYCKAPFFLGGSWDRALECAVVISKLNAAQGFRANGFVHSAQKKTTQAEKEYSQAVQLEPNNPENDYALAQFYADHKKYDKAMAIYEDLLKKDPKNMVTAFHLGQTSAECGQGFDKGIVCLSQYLTYTPKPNEPSTSGASLYLAMIYEKKGDKSKAKSYYQASLKLEPGMKEAKEGLERVD
jgi:tetratricopeptide (TPR) repeat protein